MKRPEIHDNNLRRARMHNKGDLKAYAQPSKKTSSSMRDQERKNIEQHIEDYLAAGGVIDVLEPGETNYHNSPIRFTI